MGVEGSPGFALNVPHLIWEPPFLPGPMRTFGHAKSRGKGKGLRGMLNVDITMESGKGR